MPEQPQEEVMNRRLGLAILAALSVADIADLALTEGQHPPFSVAVIGAALGVMSLVLVVLAWRGGRWALAPLVALRALSALSALPAFLVGGVPAAAQVLAAVMMGLTALGIALVARPRRAVEVVS
jgi:hypothetical protein